MAQAKAGLDVLKQTFSEFAGDDCPRMAAALAYYTVFSLPPLLVILVTIAGTVWDPEQVRSLIQQQVGSAIGPGAQEQILTMIESAGERLQGGFSLGLILSIAGVLFGATGAFAQLQRALNNAWNVEPASDEGGVKSFLMKRVLSFGMILSVAVLLLVFVAATAVLSVVTGRLQGLLPEGLSQVMLWSVNIGVSFLFVTFLFAALYKVLPDVRIGWKDVWVGSALTAVLFVVGKELIGLYLAQSNPGDTYGQAGALAVILVWIYYSAMIFFVGAEFTQVWARSYGKRIEPDEDAVRVVEEKRRIPPGARRDARADEAAAADDEEGSDADAGEEQPGEERPVDEQERILRAEDEARPDRDVKG